MCLARRRPTRRSTLFPYTTLFRSPLSEETFRRRGGQGESLPGRGAVAGRGRVDIRLAEDNGGELYVLTKGDGMRSEEHTSELQSRLHVVCRLLREKKKGAGSDGKN